MNNQKGFSLIEILIACGVAGLIFLAIPSVFSDLIKQRKKLELMTNTGQFRLAMISGIQNSKSWQKTIDSVSNTSMDCLRTGAACMAGGAFQLLNADSSVAYDGTNSSAGITPDGVLCFTYSTGGNDQCPLQLDLQWQPVCSALPCVPTQVKILGRIKFNPASSTQKGSIRVAQYQFEIYQDLSVAANSLTQMATGDSHTCALISGGVKCWGGGAYGVLGNGAVANSLIPVNVVGLSTGVKSVASGRSHVCALLLTGAVKCWGWNYYGSLGNGNNVDSNVPSDVVGLSAGVSDIALGQYHSCARLIIGGIQCWGANSGGQLGTGTVSSWPSLGINVPVDVIGLTFGVAAVSAGDSHSCAIKIDGTIKCWGANWAGQLGNGSTTASAFPVSVVGLSGLATAVIAGVDHSCAILGSSGMQCWGWNYYGQLGTGSNTIFVNSTPLSVLGLSSGVQSVVAGQYSTCARVNSGVKCWGNNSFGNLGIGNLNIQNAPVDVLGLSSGVTFITANAYHVCAIVGAGAKCWGNNANGQLGNRTTTNSAIPVDVIF